jgi:predicted AAA+ superfamily ATPase
LQVNYGLSYLNYSKSKIYSIDTGLVNSVSFKFSENIGRLLENLVFIELKRRGKEIYYHKNKKECDFVIKEGLDITKAIQVCKSLESSDLRGETRKREIKGLIDALKTYNLKTGLILTEDEEETIIQDDFKIQVIPIYKWLLAKS